MGVGEEGGICNDPCPQLEVDKGSYPGEGILSIGRQHPCLYI